MSRLLGLGLLAGCLPLAHAALALPPDDWPLGHHTHQFTRKSPASKATASGWDPTYVPAHQSEKSALTSAISTFPVGLRDGKEPGDLPNVWVDPSGNNKMDRSDVAGFPTINLPGVSGPVVFIHNYRFNSKLEIRDGLKVAFLDSSFKDVVMEDDGPVGGTPFAWFVDCLINAPDGAPQSLTAFRGDYAVMYSELLGGVDGLKLTHNHTVFRSHVHGNTKPGGEHADGIQSPSGSNNWLIESNVEALFRFTNGGIYITNGQGGQANYRVVGNLVSGGQNNLRFNGQTHTNSLVWNNRFMATTAANSPGVGNLMSWEQPASTSSKSSPAGGSAWTEHNSINWKDGNIAVDGSTSGTGQDGRTWTSGNANGRPPPGNVQAEVQNKIADLEGWVATIRSSAGLDPGDPPANGGGLAAPLLLD